MTIEEHLEKLEFKKRSDTEFTKLIGYAPISPFYIRIEKSELGDDAWIVKRNHDFVTRVKTSTELYQTLNVLTVFTLPQQYC